MGVPRELTDRKRAAILRAQRRVLRPRGSAGARCRSASSSPSATIVPLTHTVRMSEGLSGVGGALSARSCRGRELRAQFAGEKIDAPRVEWSRARISVTSALAQVTVASFILIGFENRPHSASVKQSVGRIGT